MELGWIGQSDATELGQIVGAGRRIYNSTLWRRATQRRCSAVAAAVRCVRRELGDRITREHRAVDGARLFIGLNGAGEEAVLARIPRSPAKTLAELRQKVTIEFVRSATVAGAGDGEPG